MEWGTSESHTFVIRLWLEETALEAELPSWRGHVTHYPGETRRYVSDLDQVVAFVAPYLEAMGIAIERGQRAPPDLQSALPDQSASTTIAFPSHIDSRQGEFSMVQWTWTFKAEGPTDAGASPIGGSIPIEGFDKADIEVPGWQRLRVDVLPPDMKCIELLAITWVRDAAAAGTAAQGTAAATAPATSTQRVLYSIVPSGTTADPNDCTWYSLETSQLVVGRGMVEQLKNKPFQLVLANEGAPAAKISILVARQVAADCVCCAPPPKNVSELNCNPCPENPAPDCPPEKIPPSDCGCKDDGGDGNTGGGDGSSDCSSSNSAASGS